MPGAHGLFIRSSPATSRPDNHIPNAHRSLRRPGLHTPSRRLRSAGDGTASARTRGIRGCQPGTPTGNHSPSAPTSQTGAAAYLRTVRVGLSRGSIARATSNRTSGKTEPLRPFLRRAIRAVELRREAVPQHGADRATTRSRYQQNRRVLAIGTSATHYAARALAIPTNPGENPTPTHPVSTAAAERARSSTEGDRCRTSLCARRARHPPAVTQAKQSPRCARARKSRGSPSEDARPHPRHPPERSRQPAPLRRRERLAGAIPA